MGASPDERAPASQSSSREPQRNPRPPVVAALVLSIVGLVVCTAGLAASLLVDDWTWDRWIIGATAVLFAASTVASIVAARALRRGAGTARHSLEGIQAAIEIEPEVIRMVRLHTHRRGPEDLLIAAKVELLHDLSLADAAAVTKRIETNVRANVAEVRAVYLEADVDDSHRDSGSFVTDTVGHIDRHDPDYRRLTGQVAVVDASEPPAEAMTADELDDEIWS